MNRKIASSSSRTVAITLPPPPLPRSERTRQIASWFALPCSYPVPGDSKQHPLASEELLYSILPKPGQIALITGPSGSGKSSLLRAVLPIIPPRPAVDLYRLQIRCLPVVDCFGDRPILEVLDLLGRVGLAEAWTYLRTPQELSDGQRWRLRLALAMACVNDCSNAVLVCDEFCALLDRVTAAAVARSLRRLVTELGFSAIVATAHDDLLRALHPDLHIKCDFGSVKVDVIHPSDA